MRRETTIKHTPDALGLKSNPLKGKGRVILPRKVKQPSKSTVKKRAWYAFSQFIRLRDCLFTTGTTDRGRCITCGHDFAFKDLQAGHFISGRHNGNLFSEKGTHAQCRSCNIWKHGALLEYRKAIIELYSDNYDRVLEKEANESRKYTRRDLTNIAECYKMKVKELET